MVAAFAQGGYFEDRGGSLLCDQGGFRLRDHFQSGFFGSNGFERFSLGTSYDANRSSVSMSMENFRRRSVSSGWGVSRRMVTRRCSSPRESRIRRYSAKQSPYCSTLSGGLSGGSFIRGCPPTWRRPRSTTLFALRHSAARCV